MTTSESFPQQSAIRHHFDFRPIQCPICAVDDTVELGQRGGEFHRYGYGVATRIVQCRQCSLIYPNPFPFPNDAAELYGDPEKYFETHNSELKILNGRRLYRELLQRSGQQEPRLLDIGSGQGELLEGARLEGAAQVLGLELSPAMADFARREYGLTVKTMTVEEFAHESPEKWDIVVLNAVLEHVHDPDSMIRTISTLLEPGGWLFLDLPREPNLLTSIGNTVNRLAGNKAVYNLSPTWIPFHVFGFNQRSLSRLLDKHGLDMMECQVWASTGVPARAELWDRLKAWGATQVMRLANLTGSAGNMSVWARKR
jgi:SAM-dependent methyltransferase